VLHYDGTGFARVDIGTCATLRGVKAVPAGALVVGDEPAIYSVSELGVTETATPAPALKDVGGASFDDFWAVGAAGTILRGKDGDISTVDAGTTSDLNAVGVAPDGTVVVVGRDSTVLIGGDAGFEHIAYPWTGRVMLDVLSLSSDELWLVQGNGWMMHWRRESGFSIEYPHAQTLTAAHIDANGRIRAVGNGGAYSIRDGEAWNQVFPTSWDANFIIAIAGSGAENVVAADAREGSRWFDGDAWTLIPNGGVWDVWIATNEHLFSVETGSSLAGVDGCDEETVWFFGEDGASWNRQDPTSPLPTPYTVVDLDCVSTEDAWAVDENGRLFRFGGVDWRRVATPSAVSAVGAVDAAHVYVVTTDGRALQKEGLSWRELGRLGGVSVHSTIVANARDDVTFMSGAYFDTRAIARWNGVTWTIEDAPGLVNRYDAWAVPHGDLFIAAGMAGVFHRVD
jgi:hypothetical protein